MKKLDIIVVGDSPGTYVCAIYLHTANVPLTVVAKSLGLEYDCQYIAGIPDISSGEFSERCRQQAANMDIRIIEGPDLEIMYNEDHYTVKIAGKVHRADILILDKNPGDVVHSDNLLLIKDKMTCNEAIDVAGAGCKVAFAVKELLE